jgi:transposase
VQQIAPEKLVFLDETGITTSMVRLYARSVVGKRALARAPAGRYERLTLLGALSTTGLTALMSIPAFTNDAVFRAFVDQVLVPELKPGQVVVLDNLPAHKQSAVEQSIRAAGCRVLFLPRYSPDFNPIEPCWSKLKNHLRTLAARNLESLQGALVDGMNRITDSDARSWFRYAGYGPALH